jgi:hypothetical protein
MSIGSAQSSILGADLASFLASSLSSSGVTPQSSDGEVTTVAKNGDLVTTIGQGPNANVVSVTSPGGTTLTEVGYTSPVLAQKFLDSLQQALQADRADAAADSPLASGGASAASSPTDTTGADDAGLASSIQSLLSQLDAAGTPGSPGNGLETSFNSLLQSAGISAGSGGTPGGGTGSALQVFLNNALTGLKSADSSTLGSTVNTTS